jgi:hypothetical protein
MDNKPKLKSTMDNRGYHEHPVGHAINASGISGYKPVSSSMTPEERALRKATLMEVHGKPEERARFRERFTEFKEGKISKPGTRFWIPTKMLCAKCGEVKSVRQPVAAKRLYHAGGVVPAMTEYECRKCRPHAAPRATSTRKASAALKKQYAERFIKGLL